MPETLRFYKMHGLGNDFVVLDCMDGFSRDFGALALELCDRHKSVGADGLIAVLPSAVAGCRMRIFNADGSEAQMCGNGIRCVGKFAYDKGYLHTTEPDVETMSGIKRLRLSLGDDRLVATATVDMGLPVFREQSPGEGMVALSVGNPHIVAFVDDVHSFPVKSEGLRLEYHAVWPEKANVEFVERLGDGSMAQRTWERGVGETLACGTGACAAAAAAVHTGRAAFPVNVRLLGGDLLVDRDSVTGHLLMTGPATMVFSGEITLCGDTSSGSL